MIYLDPLRGLTARQRRAKEREDAEYLLTHPEFEAFADPEALALFNNSFLGLRLDPKIRSRLRPFDRQTKPDIVICARHDLNHPLYFADNKFTNCADCGCDLQYRPHVPPDPPKVCVCCAARRQREAQQK